MTDRRSVLRGAAAAFVGAAMAATALSTPVRAQDAQDYLLATASTGGTYYPVGVALATLVKVKLQPKDKINMSAISSAGSGENVKLIRENEAQFAILQGLFGAYAAKGTGPIAGLYDQEQRLNQLEANVLHLRPTYFMENLFTGINIIKNMGVNGSPANADVKIPLIASVDVANYAAKRLLALDFSGNSVQELLGERDLNMEEVTQILGKAIGKPDLAYVTFPYDQAREAMLEMGITASVTDGYIEMYKAINNRFGVAVMKRDKENTTPTSLEQFADVFARVYQNA